LTRWRKKKMRGVNKVILVGNLGRDPETKHLQGGIAVTTFSIATSESWKDKQSGESKERTEWHNVTCFARLAEIAGQYLKKGSKVYIEGQLRTSSWEKDGQKHYKTEAMARELQMLDGKGERQEPRQDRPIINDNGFDDSIPF
jgi:single-strand DNA-binding protein